MVNLAVVGLVQFGAGLDSRDHAPPNQFPDTAIHTAPGVVDASPTCRTTGTYPPGCTPFGDLHVDLHQTRDLPWRAARRLNAAWIPPIVTFTGRMGLEPPSLPSTPPGEVWPSPVA